MTGPLEPAGRPVLHFVAVFRLKTAIVVRVLDGQAVDRVELEGVEANGQRWGYAVRLHKPTAEEKQAMSYLAQGRAEDRGWVRLPSYVLDEELGA